MLDRGPSGRKAFRDVQRATETGPVRRHRFVDGRPVSRGRS
jgi:hypothetical protein